MDPDLVRLILVVLGVVLVAGIYLWDRYKRSAPQRRRVRRSPAPAPVEGGDSGIEPALYDDPWDQGNVEPVPPMSPDADDIEPRHSGGQHAGSALDPEPAELGEWSEPVRRPDPQIAMDLNFDAHGDGDYLNTDPALLDEVERKIIVINLAAREDAFSGAAIERACQAAELTPGDMSIYHRLDGRSGRVLFSMASMVEPGTFPFGDMTGFTTPGLSLFTQLPGARDGVEIYDAMLSAAEKLAGPLRAELQDERHNKLTRQMREHTRESIIEHRRKIRLARSRR